MINVTVYLASSWACTVVGNRGKYYPTQEKKPGFIVYFLPMPGKLGSLKSGIAPEAAFLISSGSTPSVISFASFSTSASEPPKLCARQTQD